MDLRANQHTQSGLTSLGPDWLSWFEGKSKKASKFLTFIPWVKTRDRFITIQFRWKSLRSKLFYFCHYVLANAWSVL